MAADQPLWLENAGAVYSGRFYRRWLKGLHNNRPGIFRAGDLKVTQRAAGVNLSVDVAPGTCLVLGTESADQGLYVYNDEAIANVAIAGGGAQARIDVVAVRIRDQEYSGVVNSGAVVVVQGAEAGSPVAPALPANCFELARVAVAAGAASITNANITDRRDVASSYHYAAPWGTAWGERTRSTATGNTALTSGNTILTGSTINVLAGRKLLVEATSALLIIDPDERGRIWLEESVDGGAFAEIAELVDHRAGVATARCPGMTATRRTITADGTRAYRLRGERVSGTGTVTAEANATNPTELIVADIGPGALA